MKSLVIAFVFGVAAFGMSGDDLPPMPAKCVASAAAAPSLSQTWLDTMTTYWQRVLKLDDWEVRAHFVTFGDLPEDAMGASSRIVELRVLSIELLLPSEYCKASVKFKTVEKKGAVIVRDLEDTIVHELVHLRLREIAKSAQSDLEEVTVNRITTALLDARYALTQPPAGWDGR